MQERLIWASLSCVCECFEDGIVKHNSWKHKVFKLRFRLGSNKVKKENNGNLALSSDLVLCFFDKIVTRIIKVNA